MENQNLCSESDQEWKFIEKTGIMLKSEPQSPYIVNDGKFYAEDYLLFNDGTMYPKNMILNPK